MTRALLGALLRCAPGDFRRRYGEELLRVHDERAGLPRSAARRLAFAAGEITGMLLLVARLRLGGAWRRGTTTRGDGMSGRLWQDLRHAARTLGRHPGYAAVAVTVLALGIGANTAIFGVANAYFFRPLPFAGEDRLVALYETNPEFGWTDATSAPANALDWRERVEAFQDVALYSEFVNRVTYVQDGEPILVGFTNVSGNFFDVLGVPPLLGRSFRWEETWEGNDDVVVLSHALWVSLFGADPDVVGRTMDFGATTVEVVGVMPRGFRFPDDGVQLWSPWGWDPASREAVWFRRAHWVRPVARLEPGVSHEEADAQLQAVVRSLQTEYPETNRVMGAGMAPLRDFLVRGVRTPVLALVGAVTLLLLLACVNVANLSLVRAEERKREVALRFALGAGRRRVAALVAAESVLLAALGGAIGLALGWIGVRAIEGMTPVGITGATGAALDARVVLFTLAATGVCALLFSLAPVARALRGSGPEGLGEAGRGATSGRGGRRASHLLVAAEVALALLIVAGAGLMLRTAWLLRQADPGFRTEGVLAVEFGVPSTRYPGRAEVLAFQDRFVEAVEGRPGIVRAGVVGQLPLAGTSWSSQFQAEGWPPERVGLEILHRRADEGYFEALGIPLVRGRMFGPADGSDSPLVVLVNETFAREHFPGEDPIGQRIAYDRAATAESTWYEIVGIVGDQNQESPGTPARAEAFEHRDQDWARSVWVVMRTEVEPTAAVPAVREALRELDPLVPLTRVRTLREVWRSSMARQDLVLVLLGVFGVVALLLAAVGVYGVTAQAARTRTQEIGIRMALGAVGRDVVRMILRQGMTAVLAGLVIGLAAALAATRALDSLLYRVEPSDPATLSAVALLLGAVALAASWIPARRATRVDPVDSLRVE